MGLHFSQEEFKSRKSKVLNSMKEQNIDALLMFRQESMYWLTGYDTFGYVFFQTLILDKNGNIILLTRAPDLRQAQNTSNIEDIRIWVDKDGSNPTDDLKVILDELNLKGKKLGVEYDINLNIDLQIEGYIKDFTQLTNINRSMISNYDNEFIVEQGTANGDSGFVLTNNGPVSTGSV